MEIKHTQSNTPSSSYKARNEAKKEKHHDLEKCKTTTSQYEEEILILPKSTNRFRFLCVCVCVIQ